MIMNLINSKIKFLIFLTAFLICGGAVFAAGGPVISTKSVQYISENSATAVAQVNPNGFNTNVWFEWSHDPSLLSRNQGNKTLPQPVGSGNSSITVYADFPSLVSDQLYYYRAVAGNYENTVFGSTFTFRTKRAGTGVNGNQAVKPPVINTRGAENITFSSATLKTDVNPGGLTATVWFEWGPSSSGLAFRTISQSIGSGNSNASILAGLNNLSSGTVYFFRPVIQNQSGLFYGSTRSFTTKAARETVSGQSISQNGGFVGFSLKPQSASAKENSAPALLTVNVMADKTRVLPGESLVYNIRYRNIGAADADDAVLKVALPKDLELENTSPLCYGTEENNLVFSLGRVRAGDDKNVALKIKASEASRMGKILALNASLDYIDTSSNLQKKTDDVLEVAVGEQPAGRVLAAVGFFSGSSSIWLLLTFLLVLAAVIYHVHSRRKIHKMLTGE